MKDNVRVIDGDQVIAAVEAATGYLDMWSVIITPRSGDDSGWLIFSNPCITSTLLKLTETALRSCGLGFRGVQYLSSQPDSLALIFSDRKGRHMQLAEPDASAAHAGGAPEP